MSFIWSPYIGQLGGEWTKWDTPLILPTASRSCHLDQFLKRGKHILKVQGQKAKLKLPTHTLFFCDFNLLLQERLCFFEQWVSFRNEYSPTKSFVS